jgi:hypothetical protein
LLEIGFMCAASQEIAWARKFANELGFLQLAPTILHVDASAAARIAERGSFKDKTKALGIRYYHICEFVERGIVQIKRISRNLNWADIGTAARGKPELELACTHIYGEI